MTMAKPRSPKGSNPSSKCLIDTWSKLVHWVRVDVKPKDSCIGREVGGGGAQR